MYVWRENFYSTAKDHLKNILKNTWYKCKKHDKVYQCIDKKIIKQSLIPESESLEKL